MPRPAAPIGQERTSDPTFVQRHPLVGERIIAAAPALAAAAKLVRSTHERLDGLGYPAAWPASRSRWAPASSPPATPSPP
jgi:hypothetical protein